MFVYMKFLDCFYSDIKEAACIYTEVQPLWIQGDSKVGTESASLEMTCLITDRKGLED